MMRLRAGSGGGYACRVQRRKALAAEAGGSSVWNRNRAQPSGSFLPSHASTRLFANARREPAGHRAGRAAGASQLKIGT